MSKKARQVRKPQRQQEEQLQQDKLNTANAEATAAIKAFLRMPPTIARSHADNPAWHLHVLCRSGDDENFGYHDWELEGYKRFMEQLAIFFLRSDNAKRFNKQIGNQQELGERLSKLTEYFDSLIYSWRSKAELDLIDTDHFASLDEKECERIIWLYSREKRLAEAKNAAFFAPDTKAAA